MREKLNEFIGDCFVEDCRSASGLTEAIVDALPGMIKPLEWEVFDSETAWARSPFGTYRYGGEALTLSTQKNYVGDGLGNWRMVNIDAAKAAAQADYTRRIMSAFGL